MTSASTAAETRLDAISTMNASSQTYQSVLNLIDDNVRSSASALHEMEQLVSANRSKGKGSGRGLDQAAAKEMTTRSRARRGVSTNFSASWRRSTHSGRRTRPARDAAYQAELNALQAEFELHLMPLTLTEIWLCNLLFVEGFICSIRMFDRKRIQYDIGKAHNTLLHHNVRRSTHVDLPRGHIRENC